MPSRYKSRQTALQLLYLRDIRQEPVAALLEDYYHSLASEQPDAVPARDLFAEELAFGTVERLAEIDRHIGEHSENWRLERMAVVDRNILRLAVYELLALPTPSAVVIDQALDLAKKFSAEKSLAFLNGVLDAVNQRLRGGASDPAGPAVV